MKATGACFGPKTNTHTPGLLPFLSCGPAVQTHSKAKLSFAACFLLQHREINDFIHSLENAGSDHEVGELLKTALPDWRWPRTDLQFWIRVLNRLDDILADICASYHLKDGHVQLNDFTPKTKELLLAILDFTRILLENATNKRTWNGYDVSRACIRVARVCAGSTGAVY